MNVLYVSHIQSDPKFILNCIVCIVHVELCLQHIEKVVSNSQATPAMNFQNMWLLSLSAKTERSGEWGPGSWSSLLVGKTNNKGLWTDIMECLSRRTLFRDLAMPLNTFFPQLSIVPQSKKVLDKYNMKCNKLKYYEI